MYTMKHLFAGILCDMCIQNFFPVTYGNLHYPVQLKHIEILLGIYVKQECTLVFWDLCVGQWLLVTGL